MQQIKQHIPNAVTCLNLICGAWGIVLAFESEEGLLWAPFLVWAALWFDFLDGFLARMLGVHNRIGKDLDSLADMVTFGVFPALVMYNLMRQVSCDPTVCTGIFSSEYFPYTSFLIIVMSAMRLARFNVDTREIDGFMGVPTPTNAQLITALPLIASKYTFYHDIIMQPKVLLGITVVMSYLLVAEIPLLSLKMKNWRFEKENIYRYVFVVTSLIIYIIWTYATIPIIIGWYILLSLIRNFLYKKQQ